MSMSCSMEKSSCRLQDVELDGFLFRRRSRSSVAGNVREERFIHSGRASISLGNPAPCEISRGQILDDSHSSRAHQTHLSDPRVSTSISQSSAICTVQKQNMSSPGRLDHLQMQHPVVTSTKHSSGKSPSSSKTVENRGSRQLHQEYDTAKTSLSRSAETEELPLSKSGMVVCHGSESELHVSANEQERRHDKVSPSIPRKRRRCNSARYKLYETIPGTLPEEERFLTLVKLITQSEVEKAAKEEPALDSETLNALELVISGVVDVAQDYARHATPAYTRTRANCSNAALRRREVLLEHLIQQYTNELSQWEELIGKLESESDISCAGAGAGAGAKHPEKVDLLPALPALSDLISIDPLTNVTKDVKQASDSFILHQDEINHSVKRIDLQQARDNGIIEAVVDTLNANVFDGVLNLDCNKVSASPT